jgi:hypothetical protein
MNSNHLTHCKTYFGKPRPIGQPICCKHCREREQPFLAPELRTHDTLTILSNANINKSFVWIWNEPRGSSTFHMLFQNVSPLQLWRIAATGSHVCACPTTNDPQTSRWKYLDLGSAHISVHQKKGNVFILYIHPLVLIQNNLGKLTIDLMIYLSVCIEFQVQSHSIYKVAKFDMIQKTKVKW